MTKRGEADRGTACIATALGAGCERRGGIGCLGVLHLAAHLVLVEVALQRADGEAERGLDVDRDRGIVGRVDEAPFGLAGQTAGSERAGVVAAQRLKDAVEAEKRGQEEPRRRKERISNHSEGVARGRGAGRLWHAGEMDTPRRSKLTLPAALSPFQPPFLTSS